MTSADGTAGRAHSSAGTLPGQRVPPVPAADRTAIYCRKSQKGDKEQITVNRQKRLALEDSEKLGLTVPKKHIYIDNGASAWKRDRKRPGWDELLEAARRGEIKHIICYHPDRLMRQPHDLEELLSIADKHGIILYGRVNRKDLKDPHDRYDLRIEVAHACRSSDDTSRRLRDQKQERAENGQHNGTRPYGYSPNGMRIVQKEAVIVREIFKRFTKGEGPSSIATDLNRRGIKTAHGKAWSDASVRRQLRCHHVAGISWHKGKEMGKGKWPEVIDRPTWDFAQELLAFRSKAAEKNGQKKRFYLLRGLVICGRCGTSMTGCSGKYYRCARAIRQDDKRCARSIRAEALEQFAQDAAVRLLHDLSVNGRPSRNPQIQQAEAEITDDEQRIKELNEMWKAKEITSAEYKDMRREVQNRIRANERKTVVTRRPIESLGDLVGPNSEKKWSKLSDDRKNAVLRFLFSSVIIGEQTKPPGITDYDRIEIEENELA